MLVRLPTRESPISERRLLLVDTSRMLGELIREFLRNRPHVTVVGEVRRPVDLRSAMCATGANSVIVSASDSRVPPDCQDLIEDYSTIKVVVLVEEGADGFVWQLQPRRVRAGAMTQADLLTAIGAP